MEADLQILQDDRVKFHGNPLLGYLKVNNLYNNVTDLTDNFQRTTIRLLCFE